MTPKQVEKIKLRIKKIKAELARDKKFWGGYYHDGRGLRYLLPKLYIQISDYPGGLRYINWFYKNFPDEIGFPDYLFECTIIFFMAGMIKDAKKKAFETFCSNTYIFDKFFCYPVIAIAKHESFEFNSPEFTKYLTYSYRDPDLVTFTNWLKEFRNSEKFIQLSNKYLEFCRQLNLSNSKDKFSQERTYRELLLSEL